MKAFQIRQGYPEEWFTVQAESHRQAFEIAKNDGSLNERDEDRLLVQVIELGPVQSFNAQTGEEIK